MIFDNLTLAGLLVVLVYSVMLAVLAGRGIVVPENATARVRKTQTTPRVSTESVPCACGACA